MMKYSDIDWWQFKNRILKHNYHRRHIITASHVLVFDKSMSAFVSMYER